MDIVLIILGAICLLAGIVGCILPVIPGVPLAYGGLILLHLTDKVDFTWRFLIIWGIVTIVVQVLDYVIPAWGTKRFGGSKWGVWGSTIGLLVGLFMGFAGIVIGPFCGAVLGEILYFNRHPQPSEDTHSKSNLHQALRAGLGSFMGLLTGTLLKLVCCGWMVVEFVKVLV